MKINRLQCPICQSDQLKTICEVQDFSVTKESFPIIQCKECTFRFTQSVPDENSITPYYQFEEYISHTNTNQSLFHKVYHKVRNFTLKQKLNWLKQYTGKSEGKLLDIGCGTGAFLAYAQKNNWAINGIEADSKARKNAFTIHGIKALPNEELYTLQEKYDAITLWHVLEHVHDLNGYLKKMHDLLSDHGTLFIAVPNHTSFDAKHYQQFWAAYDVPRHLYHFNPESMQILAKKFGYSIIAHKRMWFDSVYVSILSEKNKKGSSIKGALIGLYSNMVAFFQSKKCSSITYVLKRNT